MRVNKWSELKAKTNDIFNNLTLNAELDHNGDIQFVISGVEKPSRTISPEVTLSSNSKGAKISGGIHFMDQHFRGLGETIEIVVSQLDEDENLLFSSIPNIQFKWSENSIGKLSYLTVGYDQNRDSHKLKQLFKKTEIISFL